MQTLWQTRSPMLTARRGTLRLVTLNGVRVDPEPLDITASHEPEQQLTVEFEGLTEAEQLRALAAFPGGKRFQLGRTGS